MEKPHYFAYPHPHNLGKTNDLERTLRNLAGAGTIALITACGGGGSGSNQEPIQNPITPPPANGDNGNGNGDSDNGNGDNGNGNGNGDNGNGNGTGDNGNGNGDNGNGSQEPEPVMVEAGSIAQYMADNKADSRLDYTVNSHPQGDMLCKVVGDFKIDASGVDYSVRACGVSPSSLNFEDMLFKYPVSSVDDGTDDSTRVDVFYSLDTSEDVEQDSLDGKISRLVSILTDSENSLPPVYGIRTPEQRSEEAYGDPSIRPRYAIDETLESDVSYRFPGESQGIVSANYSVSDEDGNVVSTGPVTLENSTAKLSVDLGSFATAGTRYDINLELKSDSSQNSMDIEKIRICPSLTPSPVSSREGCI